MKKSGLADSPFFSVPQNKNGTTTPLLNKPLAEKKKDKTDNRYDKLSTTKKPSTHDTKKPRNHDTTVSRYHGITVLRNHYRIGKTGCYGDW